VNEHCWCANFPAPLGDSKAILLESRRTLDGTLKMSMKEFMMERFLGKV
jgi:hypothetical protein